MICHWWLIFIDYIPNFHTEIPVLRAGFWPGWRKPTPQRFPKWGPKRSQKHHPVVNAHGLVLKQPASDDWHPPISRNTEKNDICDIDGATIPSTIHMKHPPESMVDVGDETTSLGPYNEDVSYERGLYIYIYHIDIVYTSNQKEQH